MGAYPQIVDWNADGKIDLAVGDSYGNVTLFLNTGSAGNPVLTKQGLLQAAGVMLDVGDRAAPVFVDWNNDGKKDLVIGNHYPGEIRLYLNNGTNSAPVFTTYTTLQADGNPLNEVAACPEVWDLDGDRRKDLLVSSYSGGVTFYKNIGADANPVLAAGEKIQAGGRELLVGSYARLDLADWDADGDKDLLVGDWDGYVTLFLNQMPPATITLTAPNGGENWAIGSSQVITWTHTGALSQVKVELSRHNGAAWETLAASTPNDGSEAWTVTGPAATTCRIRISDLDGSPSDQSDAVFTIYQLETIAVTAPNGGEIWNVNSSQNITWNSSGNFANVKIELSRDYGSSWETLVATTPNDGAQVWQVSGPGAAACLMRIADVDGSPVDQSDRSFSIYQPETITITTPNGGENWAIGSNQNIQWTTTGAVGNVKIELTRNNGANWETLFVSTFNRGAQSWTVIGPAATACRLRISDVDGAPMDQSDATFTIYQPQTLTITAPNGNETWAIGSSQDITWTSAGAVGNVKIELSRNQGATWESLFTNTANDGVQSWLVTGPAAASCLVRISEVDGTPVDQSNAAFTIYQPETITLTAPNGDETWAIGSNQNIQWTSIGNFSNVKIEISRNNGLSWETLFAASPNDGAQTWAVTGPTGAACRLRIADVDGSPVDQSDGAFTIFQPESLTLLAPNGGENWALGSSQNISWTSTGAVGNVKIEISRNNAVSWEMLWADTPNDGLESWQVTGPASATCRVRITDVDGNPTAQSVRTFAIYQPESITITAPNGGENWQVGSMQNITWVSTGVSAQVNIELTRDQGFTWEVLFTGVPNDGLQPWVVTVPVGYNCRLRISDVDGSIADLSDAMFTIFQAEMLSVTVPNGSENWAIDSNVTLTWSAAGTSGNLKIEISRNNSATWEVLFASTPDDGNQSWLVTGPATTTASVRISDVDGSIRDQSDAVFTIYQPDLISIRTPNGGEDWLIGAEQHITWAATGAFNAVNIELSRDRGTTWELLFENTANDFDQPWQVTGPATLEALIRISDTDGTPTA
ncbi:VCBS repeat-containing protein, partial [candidate division KSB1 bacterium]|nr:VCBS repeat-containing protein [candidate division KSB1 bacterium]